MDDVDVSLAGRPGRLRGHAGVLEFTINGKRYPSWPRTPGDLGGVAEAAWLLLLDAEPPKPPVEPPAEPPKQPAGVAEATSLLLLDAPPPRRIRPRRRPGP